MRAAALIADGSIDRLEARERVEAALELERAQMNGAPSRAPSSWPAGPRKACAGMLREAALGELGADLSRSPTRP